MNGFNKQFSDWTSEHLLQLRARGDELSDDAHQAIEEIFAERGEHLPVKPKTPIFITNNDSLASSSSKFFKANETPTSGVGKFIKSAAFYLLAILAIYLAILAIGFASIIGKAYANTWFSVLAMVGIGIYLIANWLRRQKLSSAEKEREDSEKEAREEGLSEIMVCAVSGNLERIRELIEYGGDVNSKSFSGATALMYAARNNHLSIVKFLLIAGADLNLKTDKKSTASDIAKKFGHLEIAELLERHVA